MARYPIDGLREFKRELKSIDREFDTDFGKIGHKKVAEFLKPKVSAVYSSLPGVASKFASKVKAGASGQSAYISIGAITASGSTELPVHGSEFGGGRYGAGRPSPRGGYTTQFEPHQGTTGYGLYPTIRRNDKEILSIYDDFLETVARKFAS